MSKLSCLCYFRSYESKLSTSSSYTSTTVLIHSPFAQIAQLVEQGTENPCVTGSIPVLGIPDCKSGFFILEIYHYNIYFFM